MLGTKHDLIHGLTSIYLHILYSNIKHIYKSQHRFYMSTSDLPVPIHCPSRSKYPSGSSKSELYWDQSKTRLPQRQGGDVGVRSKLRPGEQIPKNVYKNYVEMDISQSTRIQWIGELSFGLYLNWSILNWNRPHEMQLGPGWPFLVQTTCSFFLQQIQPAQGTWTSVVFFAGPRGKTKTPPWRCGLISVTAC